MSLGSFDLDLSTPANNGVYQVDPADLADLAALARTAGLRVSRIDLHGCISKSVLMLRMATQLDFPGSFGRNWDALTDALRDLAWLPAPGGHALMIEGSDLLAERQPEAYATLLDILDDAAHTWATDHQLFVAFVAQPAQT